jgi:outer membrane protein assembly factor BamE (lipoprotein component of BamABCDE complex)
VLTIFILSACAQPTPYLYEAGEKPIPPGIENQIHPNSSTQDDVLALLGEPVARLKTTTKEGHVHVWTYSYMILKGTQKGKGESLKITFDDKSFVVISVIRGPL